MGCSSSTDTSHTHNNRPQARVYPTQKNSGNTTKNVYEWIDDEDTDIVVKPVKIDKAILERYMQLDREIQQCEGHNVLKNIEVKKDQTKDLEGTIQQLALLYQQCVQQTAKEKADVENMPSVRTFFKDQTQYDERMSKEQEEYLDALNKQEIAKKELDGVTKQKELLLTEIAAMEKDSSRLQELYTEQDELLAGIFDGKYGSDYEFQLEMELDNLNDRKQRISVAKYKWQNSRVLMQYACNQLQFAVKRWQELCNVPINNMQARYLMATETRNHLIAANQNITSAQRYLHTIQFPYCKPDEMTTLTRATNNIYTDMQTQDRHTHAMQCYTVTQKRAAALLQWFDQVINTTIIKDLDKVNAEVKQKTKELRKERLRLIKVKIQQQEGSQVNLDVDADFEDDEVEDSSALAHGWDADQVSNAGDIDLPTGDGAQQQPAAAPATKPDAAPVPAPIPLNELAPPPKNNELFGNIDEIRKQHEANIEAFNKAQESNRHRMEQGLQEKLRARRSKRRRLDVQEQQAMSVK